MNGDDTFASTLSLVSINLYGNIISEVKINILKPLLSLYTVDMRNNICVNEVATGTRNLARLSVMMDLFCTSLFDEIKEKMFLGTKFGNEFENLNAKVGDLESSNRNLDSDAQRFNETIQSLEKEIKETIEAHERRIERLENQVMAKRAALE